MEVITPRCCPVAPRCCPVDGYLPSLVVWRQASSKFLGVRALQLPKKSCYHSKHLIPWSYLNDMQPHVWMMYRSGTNTNNLIWVNYTQLTQKKLNQKWTHSGRILPSKSPFPLRSAWVMYGMVHVLDDDAWYVYTVYIYIYNYDIWKVHGKVFELTLENNHCWSS